MILKKGNVVRFVNLFLRFKIFNKRINGVNLSKIY